MRFVCKHSTQRIVFAPKFQEGKHRSWPNGNGFSARPMIAGILLALIAMVFSGGCGVSKKIHSAAVQELETTKSELGQTRSERETLNKEVEDLKGQVEGLEFSVAARNTELEALRQQNLELMNIRDNQFAEIEELRNATGRLTESKNKEIERLRGTYDSLVQELQGEIKKGEIKITQVLDRLTVNLVERILFDSGSVDIKPDGLNVLERVGGILKKVADKQIRVEGHTDNVAIGEKLIKTFPTNWELSVTRATNVVRFLSDHVGIDPKLLSASGYSMYRPVASNETKESRAQNRRIEITLLPINLDRVLQDLR
jgi:chemotaxis protein MotB